MQSSGDSYHVEINGIAEGPMTVRDLVWKIGMAGNDDVIRFRQEGSGDWQPLEGNRDRLQQLASAEPGQAAAPASPPKLKLKRRGDAPSPSGNETPPPFPSEPPTPPTVIPRLLQALPAISPSPRCRRPRRHPSRSSTQARTLRPLRRASRSPRLSASPPS